MAKAKSRKIVTTEVIEGEPEAQPEAPPPQPVEVHEDEAISDFLARVGLDEGSATVYRVGRGGAKEWCFRAPISEIEESRIRDEFGPGRYVVRILDSRGRYVQQVSVFVAEPVKAPAAAAPQVVNAGADIQIQLLREQLARQHEMILKMMETKAAEPKENPVADIIAGVQAMYAMAPKPESNVQTVLEALTSGIRLASELGGGGDEKMSWVRVIEHALEKLPMIGAAVSAGLRGGEAPAGTAVPSRPNGDMEMQALRAAIAYLKQKCLRQADPDLFVDYISNNLDDYQWTALTKLLAGPYENLGQIDPDLLTEPYRSWFFQLYTGLKDALSGSASATRGAGDDPDLADDGTARPPGARH